MVSKHQFLQFLTFFLKKVTCFAFMAQIVSNRVTSKIKIFNANWFHLSFALFELFPQRLSFCSFWALSVILILSSYAKPSQSQTGITKSETFHARLPQIVLLPCLCLIFSFVFTLVVSYSVLGVENVSPYSTFSWYE